MRIVILANMYQAIKAREVRSIDQVVIPKDIRENLKLKEGDKLIAYNKGELIILRRLEGEESILSLLSKPISRKIAELGVTKKDLDDAVKWAREKP